MSRKLAPGQYVLRGQRGVLVNAVVKDESITIKAGSRISAGTSNTFAGKHWELKAARDQLLAEGVLEPRTKDGRPLDDPNQADTLEVMQDISKLESSGGKPLTPHKAASLALASDASATKWDSVSGTPPETQRYQHSPNRESTGNMYADAAPLGPQPEGATKSMRSNQNHPDLGDHIATLQKELAKDYPNYETATKRVTSDIIEYINSKHPRPAFSITSRIKDPKSLENKVLRKHKIKNYQKLSDFSDIAGVRLILYSTDFQGTIEDLSARWSTGSGQIRFAKKDDNYELKGTEPFDPNDAGDSWYFAYHFDLRVTEQKDGYDAVETACEVQVTNIMRHAINEIGHDLVYKPSHPDKNVRKAWETDQGLKDIFWALQLTLDAASKAVSKIQSKAYAIERSTEKRQVGIADEGNDWKWQPPFIGSKRATLDATETLAMRLGLEWKQADKEAGADISERVPTVLQYAVNKGNSTIRKIVEDLDSPQGLVSSLEKLNMGGSLVLWSLENLLDPYNAKARVEHEARANGSNRAWLTPERSSDIVLLLLLELLAIKDPKGAAAFYTGGATGDPRRKQGAPRILDRIVKTFMDGRSDRR